MCIEDIISVPFWHYKIVSDFDQKYKTHATELYEENTTLQN